MKVRQNYNHKGKVPGYIGFIPGLKSENVFGKTYGNITTTIDSDITQSRNGQDNLHCSMAKKTFVDPKAMGAKGTDPKVNTHQKSNINHEIINSFFAMKDDINFNGDEG